MKITQQVDAYLTNVQLSRTVSPETERLYTLYLGKYLVFRKSRRLTRSSITPAEVNAFLAWYDNKSLERRGRRLSIHAYDKIFDVLRTFCSWSSDLGHLKKNPFRFLKPPKVPKKTLRTIAPMPDVARFLYFVENRAPGARPNGLGLPTDKDAARRVLELEAYRSHALAARDAAFYGTLFYGGLRISEACPIDAERDVDLRQGFISVRRGKGGEPRLIPIRRELRAILCRWIKLRARLLERFSITSSALFPSLPGHGRPWAGEAASVKSAWMSKLLRVKYLPLMRARGAPRVFMQRFTPHGFRHSIATYLLNHDVDLQDVQEFLGHQDPATTTLYNHQQPKHLQRMIARA